MSYQTGQNVLSVRSFCPICVSIIGAAWQLPPSPMAAIAARAAAVKGVERQCPLTAAIALVAICFRDRGALLPPDPPFPRSRLARGRPPRQPDGRRGDGTETPAAAGLLKRMLSVCHPGKCQKMSIKCAKYMFGAENPPYNMVIALCEL